MALLRRVQYQPALNIAKCCDTYLTLIYGGGGGGGGRNFSHRVMFYTMLLLTELEVHRGNIYSDIQGV